MRGILGLKKIKDLFVGEHFFTEKVDWYIYYLIIIFNSLNLKEDVLYYPLTIPISGLFIALISIIPYKISSKGKKVIFEEQSLLSNFVWHAGGLGIGIFSYLIYMNPGLAQAEEFTYDPLNLIFMGYTIIFILLVFFKPIDLPYSEYKDVKQIGYVLKREFSRDYRKLMYHVGNCLNFLYSKIVSISIIIVIIFTFLFIFSLISSPVIFPLSSIFNINEDTSSDTLTIFIEMLPLLIIFSLILLVLSFFSYISLDSFTIGLLNFGQGLTGEYNAIDIPPPQNYSLENKMNMKFYHKTYWEPVIETSFFIIAIFIFTYTIISLPGLISFIVSILLGLNVMVAIWILEDLCLNLNKEKNPFLGFVKYIRLSKDSIQIASVYPLAKWITKSFVIEPFYIPILEIEMPLHRFMIELSFGGLMLILFISLLNTYTWCYLRFLKSKYTIKVNDLHAKIITETSEKYKKIKDAV